jgi:hypothetical protein
MTDDSHADGSVPTPEELRGHVEETREQLGRTVEALVAKVDVKTRVEHKAAVVKEQAREKATHTKTHLRETAAHVLHRKQDKAPRVREQADQGTQAARRSPAPLLAAAATAAAITVLLVVRRRRRQR